MLSTPLVCARAATARAFQVTVTVTVVDGAAGHAAPRGGRQETRIASTWTSPPGNFHVHLVDSHGRVLLLYAD